MTFPSEKHNNVDDFLTAINLCNPSWWNKKQQCHWIFRGQLSKQDLIPSLYRKTENSNELYYQRSLELAGNSLMNEIPLLNASTVLGSIKSSGFVEKEKLEDKQIKNLAEIIMAAYIELDITEKFLIRCNNIRLQTPTLTLFKEQETSISSVKYYHYNFLQFIKLFLRAHSRHKCNESLLFGTRFFPYLYPEAMALARHHHVPSRLLDWTKDPLIAAFFAASNNANDDICIWALYRENINDCPHYGQLNFYDKLPLSGLEYLHIQQGIFTDMIGQEMYQYLYGHWPTLDQYLEKTFIDRTNTAHCKSLYLKKIILDKKEVPNLIIRLDNMGYNTYKLMPTYDNVGQSVTKHPNM